MSRPAPRALRHAPAARLVAALAVAGLATTACTASDAREGGPRSSGRSAGSSADASPQAGSGRLRLSSNVDGKQAVPVDKVVKVSAANGDLESVQLRTGDTSVAGAMGDDGTWTASALLEPHTQYQVVMTGTDASGDEQTDRSSFSTVDLSLEQQTYPSFLPDEGSTVGVGMPVIVRFDIPVERKAAIERHLVVDSEPAVTGTWHWVSDTEVHYRPRTYWEPGTQVSVDADINGVDAGNGIYGQQSRSSSFTIGDSVISRINLKTYELEVDINGTLARTIPISGGAPGYESRSGTKVIIEKFLEKRMDAATTGVSPDDPDYYNIPDVQYAMRVTYTGEFLHAAPWSVGSQGSANVSHGCIGMSTKNAHWLYKRSSIGDVVVTTGSDRLIEPGNGYTDWDVSFAEYEQGSALS